MLRRPLTTGLGLLVLLFAVTAQAADEYWVTVGSYQTIESAEDARGKASQTLPESFGVSEVQLDSGLWYRVLAGPYLTQEIADHIRNEADYRAHVEYCWFNPVKHGFVEDPSEWPYSSYHRDRHLFGM